MENPNKQVIYEEEGLVVTTLLKVRMQGTDFDLEPGESILIETNDASGQSVYPMGFRRWFKDQVICPYGITDAALAAILKFRFEQRRKREDIEVIDSMVLGDWIQTLNQIIED